MRMTPLYTMKERKTMIQIEDFTVSHVPQARQIALQNYNAERSHIPMLPSIDAVPDLTPYAENGLGVAAFKDGRMVGFLCNVPPFKNAFRSTDAIGVFSPMGANGAIGDNRAGIYARMYQAAGTKLVRAGASSHAVCLYAHDKEVQEQFFRYGFGLRCVDAIRGMDEIDVLPCRGVDFVSLAPGELLQVLPLDHMLDAHMATSPTFILRPSDREESFMEKAARINPRYFAAKIEGKIIAFIKAEGDGETFICDAPGYFHITGAFCLPEYRGKGVYHPLFNLLIRTLKHEGYTRLGVDFESINPAAYGFWLKYFGAYTHGMVRRIDEYALNQE